MNYNDPQQLEAKIADLENAIALHLSEIRSRRADDPYTAARLAEGIKSAAANLQEMLDQLAFLTTEAQ